MDSLPTEAEGKIKSTMILGHNQQIGPGGGGDSHMEQMGMLVGNFEFNP